MKLVRRILLAAASLLLLAQAVPVALSNPSAPVEGNLTAPPEVQSILRAACYDCHSNETVWPWYSHVAPVSWLVAHDVSEGRRELNFSRWKSFTPARQKKKLKEIAKEVEEGEMPPWSYTLMHAEAQLAPGDRERLVAWARAELAGIAP